MRPNPLFLVALPALIAIGFGNGHSAESAILAGNHPPEADSTASVGDADPSMQLSMQIRFANRNRTELDQLLAAQQDPSSPNYHRWLKPGEYDQRFGARESDLAAVAEWLKGEGFAVESTSGGYIQFTGSVAQAQRTFSVHIARFGDDAYANVNDPSIPTRFVGVIGSILGLDNMTHAVPVGPHRLPPKP